MAVVYACTKPGCWNLTVEVLCTRHQLEECARRHARAALQAVADARRTEEGGNMIPKLKCPKCGTSNSYGGDAETYPCSRCDFDGRLAEPSGNTGAKHCGGDHTYDSEGDQWGLYQ